MLITRFNRLIQSKLIWIAFAVLVCIVFVFWGAFGDGSSMPGATPEDKAAGTLRGEPVTQQDFRLAMAYEQGFGQRQPKTRAEQETLEQETWKRIATRKPIRESLGVTVNDQDLLSVIQQEFSQNGVFNKDIYERALYENLRISKEAFEAYLRDQILYHKAGELFETCVWTPPAEVDDRLTDLTDEFVLHYVLMDAETVTEEPVVTESDLMDFYTENIASFAITEERRVRYVAFDIEKHLKEVVIKAGDVDRYYQQNAADFAGIVSNGAPLPDSVRAEIQLKLENEAAVDRARDEAMSFATSLITDRSSVATSADFLQQAAEQSLPVHTTAWFVVNEPVPGLEASQAFNRSAFRLDRNNTISETVVGAGEVYLLDLVDLRGPRTPEFEEVSEKVKTLAALTARYKAFEEKAKALEADLKAKLPGGGSFVDILASHSLVASTTTAFSVYSPAVSSNHMPVIEAVDEMIVDLDAGELTPLIPTKRGAFIGYIASRTPADILTLQALKPRLMQNLNRYRAAAVMDDWKSYELAKADLVDLRTRPPTESAVPDATATAPAASVQ